MLWKNKGLFVSHSKKKYYFCKIKKMIVMKRLFSCIIIVCLMTMVCVAQYNQLTNIPTIYIETFGNQAVASKTDYVYATITYIDGNTMVQYDSLQIRGRGNSTWKLAKKPYRIKFLSFASSTFWVVSS